MGAPVDRLGSAAMIRYAASPLSWSLMPDKREVPVYCYQCVAGPDLMKVEVEDGVAT